VDVRGVNALPSRHWRWLIQTNDTEYQITNSLFCACCCSKFTR